LSEAIDIGRLYLFIAVATEQRFEIIDTDKKDIGLCGGSRETLRRSAQENTKNYK
jgi:hypothetical protein